MNIGSNEMLMDYMQPPVIFGIWTEISEGPSDAGACTCRIQSTSSRGPL